MEVELYRGARSDLVESEWMLELNRLTEAATLAERAALGFDELGMKYECARATVIQAAACFRQGDSSTAGGLFREARKLSAREDNRYWRAILDLYRALVHEYEGLPLKAHGCCEKALRILAYSPLTGKLALCHLLLARLALAEGKLDSAQAKLREAEPLAGSPCLRFHFHYLQGVVHERRGEVDAAREEYAQAIAKKEDVRHFWMEELKIPFLDKETAVYEAEVRINLGNVKEALHFVQRAKLPDTKPAREIANLRGSLRALYRELDTETTAERAPALETLRELGARIKESEQELLRQEAPRKPPLELPRDDSALVEYFPLGERIHAWIATSERVDHVECGSMLDVKRALRLWQLQLEIAKPEAASDHIKELRTALIEPLRSFLRGTRISLSPIGLLTQVPFRDLLDGYAVSHEPDLVPGARGAYRRGDCSVEVRWSDEYLAGQIVNGREKLGGTPVVLLSHKSVLGEANCNEAGEFVMELPKRPRLRIRFDVGSGEIEIYLK